VEHVWFKFLIHTSNVNQTSTGTGSHLQRISHISLSAGLFSPLLPGTRSDPPFEQRVLDSLPLGASERPTIRATGIIHCRSDYWLRGGIGDITERERRDPRIAFLEERNPGWHPAMSWPA